MQQVKLSTLKHHPLADLLPMLPEDHPESQALLASISENEILEALIVDEDNRILNGRHRARAAKLLGLDTVPVDFVKRSEAATVAMQTALNRRSFDIGQRALLIASMFPKSAEERKARALANLKKGSNPLVSPETLKSAPGAGINELAALHGVGDDSLQRAYKVLDLPAAKREPLVNAIMSGDISLGGAVAGLAGAAATKGKERRDTDAARRLDASFRSFERNFRFWKSANAADRVRLAQVARELAKSLPAEIVAALARGCKDALKQKAS